MKFTTRVVALAAPLLLGGGAPRAVAADLELDPDSGLKWTMGEGRDAPSLTLDGRLHADYAQYSDDVTLLDDGFLLRRLRPALTLDWGDWKAKVDYEFSDRIQGVHTAYLQYGGFEHTAIRLGAQPVSFGWEASGSSNSNPFLERSLASSALAPGSMAGLSVRKWSKRWNVGAGVYGNDINDDEQRGVDGYGLIARATGLAYESDDARLHFGVSLEGRNADSKSELRYRTRPESNVDGSRLVDTHAVPGIDRLGTAAVEAGWQWGPLLLSGEYLQSQVERDAASTLSFNGWEVTGSWFPTGERRRYSEAFGAFGGVKPKHKWGAIELKARASAVDLVDEDVAGGKERNEAFGVNWWYSRNIRVLAEYVLIHTDPGDNGISEDPSVVQVRAQVAF